MVWSWLHNKSGEERALDDGDGERAMRLSKLVEDEHCVEGETSWVDDVGLV